MQSCTSVETHIYINNSRQRKTARKSGFCFATSSNYYYSITHLVAAFHNIERGVFFQCGIIDIIIYQSNFGEPRRVELDQVRIQKLDTQILGIARYYEMRSVRTATQRREYFESIGKELNFYR